MAQGEVLSAPLTLEYPFRRTVGRVQSAFLTGLREGLVLGIRTTDGRVLCPPTEYDPVTGDELSELVELPAEGTVTTWSWEPEGRPNSRCPAPSPGRWSASTGPTPGCCTPSTPAARPTPCAPACGCASAGSTPATAGDIRDIACFEPADAEGAQ